MRPPNCTARLAIGLLVLIATATAADSPELEPIPAFDLGRFEPGIQNDFSAALAEVRQNQNADPERLAISYARLGMLLHAYDLTDLAEPCYQNAARLAGQHYQWPYLLAYLYQTDGRLDEAAAFYRETLALKPDFLPALLHLGQTLGSLQQDEEAGRFFQDALALEKSNAVALEGLGNIAYRQGRYAEAIELFERALLSDPAANRLNYLLGMAHRRAGNLEIARDYLKKRGTRNPAIADPALAAMQALRNTSQQHIKAGLSAYEAGDFAAAAKAYRAAVESAPADLDTRLALAWALELTGDYPGAHTELDIVLQARPNSGKAHYLKGALLAGQGQIDKGIAHLSRAEALDPEALPPRLILAATLMHAGDYQQALEHYAWLAERQSDDVILQYRLGLAALAAGQCSVAAAPLETALRLRPGSPTVAQALLRAYSICPADDADRETALIQAQALFDQTRRWDTGATLAMALAANGRFEEAAQLQQVVIDEARRQGQSLQVLSALLARLERFRQNQPALSAWPPGADVYKPPIPSAAERQRLTG